MDFLWQKTSVYSRQNYLQESSQGEKYVVSKYPGAWILSQGAPR